jgi:hypothetical protein
LNKSGFRDPAARLHPSKTENHPYKRFTDGVDLFGFREGDGFFH